jgi:hypothetical protein
MSSLIVFDMRVLIKEIKKLNKIRGGVVKSWED